MSTRSLDYSNVSTYNDFGEKVSGTLSFTPSDLVFTDVHDVVAHKVKSTDLKEAVWMRRASDHCLAVLTPPFGSKKDEIPKEDRTKPFARYYGGLNASQLSSLTDSFKAFSIQLKVLERSYAGQEGGECDLDWAYNVMRFMVDGKLGFEIPLDHVNSCDLSSKNETVIKFKPTNNPISLMEMRLFVPSSGVGDDEEKMECFREKITRLASSFETETICDVPDVNLLVPRGRYDMKMYKGFVDLMQKVQLAFAGLAALHGKSFDYKVPYTQVVRLFHLPHLEKRVEYFAINIDPPVRQGQTLYPFLIIQCDTDDGIELEVNLPGEDGEDSGSVESTSPNVMKGDTCKVLEKIFRRVFGKKITGPGSFESTVYSGHKCIGCSFRASNGLLFVLERGLFFMHKPTIYVKYSDVLLVDLGSLKDLAKAANNLKTFTMDVQVNAGVTYAFSSIDRDEQDGLAKFLKGKGVETSLLGVEPDDPRVGGNTFGDLAGQLGRETTQEAGNSTESDDQEGDADFVAKTPEDSDADSDSGEEEEEQE